MDSFYGTDRGLTVSSEARAEISELIMQLEAQNPNPAPTEASRVVRAHSDMLHTLCHILSGVVFKSGWLYIYMKL